MKDTFKNILIGIGSILDIMPYQSPRKRSKRVRILTPEEINEKAWAFMNGTFKRVIRKPEAPASIPKGQEPPRR